MHTKWMRLWGLAALILVLTPLLAVGQSRAREAVSYTHLTLPTILRV